MKKTNVEIRVLTDAEISAVGGGYSSRAAAEADVAGYTLVQEDGSSDWVSYDGGGGDWYVRINEATHQWAGVYNTNC